MDVAQREREEIWEASMRRDRERRRLEIRSEWYGFFCRMAQAHAGIAEDYERRAEELCKEGGT